MADSPEQTPCRPLDRAVLRQARRASLRASLACAVALAAGVLALVGAALRWRDPGMLLLAAALCLGWAWLLRGAPLRWWSIGRDLAAADCAVLTGIAGVRPRRGIGWLAPTRWELLLDGRAFALEPGQARALREGRVVVVRFAPASGVLLDVSPRAPASAAGVDCVGSASGIELTPRESELLRLVAEGEPDKAIARRMGLEPATVRTYNSQLYGKLGVRRRTEAVARARALGLLRDAD